jgi:hypothetical protein
VAEPDAFAVYRDDDLVLALLREPGPVRSGEIVMRERHERLTANVRALDPTLLDLVTRADDLDALIAALRASGLTVAATPRTALEWAFR